MSSSRRLKSVRTMMLLLLLLLALGDAEAVVRRPDVPDLAYTSSPKHFQSAVIILNPDGKHNDPTGGKPGSKNFNVDCAATMISRQHAVTAAHCLCSDDAGHEVDGHPGKFPHGYKVLVAGELHTVAESYENPDCKFKCGKDGPNKCPLLSVDSGLVAKPPLTSDLYDIHMVSELYALSE
eukprot:SAG31_NODE_21328_length_552_cov_0.969095_1_plen_179_part_01